MAHVLVSSAFRTYCRRQPMDDARPTAPLKTDFGSRLSWPPPGTTFAPRAPRCMRCFVGTTVAPFSRGRAASAAARGASPRAGTGTSPRCAGRRHTPPSGATGGGVGSPPTPGCSTSGTSGTGLSRRPENCIAGGGDGMGARRRRGGGGAKMGFRAGPFVLSKDGCCHQRRRNTNFGPENFFSQKKFPPHMGSQNDQRDVGIILSHVCWGWTPPPRGQVGQPQSKPPSRHGDQGGGGGGWANGLPCHPPPPRKAIFLPPYFEGQTRAWRDHAGIVASWERVWDNDPPTAARLCPGCWTPYCITGMKR